MREPGAELRYHFQFVRWHDHRYKTNHLHQVIGLLDKRHAAEIPALAPESGIEKWAVGIELETPAVALEVIDDCLETARHIHNLAIAFLRFFKSSLFLVYTSDGIESC